MGLIKGFWFNKTSGPNDSSSATRYSISKTYVKALCVNVIIYVLRLESLFSINTNKIHKIF